MGTLKFQVTKTHGEYIQFASASSTTLLVIMHEMIIIQEGNGEVAVFKVKTPCTATSSIKVYIYYLKLNNPHKLSQPERWKSTFRDKVGEEIV